MKFPGMIFKSHDVKKKMWKGIPINQTGTVPETFQQLIA